MKNIAFIGAGEMGGRIAKRLIGAGYTLTICDMDPGVRNNFARLGMRVTDEPGDCASSDMVIVVVVDAEQIRQALFRPGGLLDHVTTRPPIVAVMSTILPDEMQAIAGGLKLKGVQTLDAPLVGGLMAAEQGKITILLAGEDPTLAAAEPVMQSISPRVVRCGSLGSGQVAKIINNILAVGNMFLSAEAFRVATSFAIPLTDIARIIDVGTGGNYCSRNLQEAADNFAAYAKDMEYFATVCRICGKDLHLAERLGHSAQLDLPILKALADAIDTMPTEVGYAHWRSAAQAARPFK